MISRRRKIARTEGSRDHFLLSRTDARRFDQTPGLDPEAVRDLVFPNVWTRPFTPLIEGR